MRDFLTWSALFRILPSFLLLLHPVGSQPLPQDQATAWALIGELRPELHLRGYPPMALDQLPLLGPVWCALLPLF